MIVALEIIQLINIICYIIVLIGFVRVTKIFIFFNVKSKFKRVSKDRVIVLLIASTLLLIALTIQTFGMVFELDENFHGHKEWYWFLKDIALTASLYIFLKYIFLQLKFELLQLLK